MNNQIILTIKEDKMTTRCQHPMDIRDVLTALATASLATMRTFVDKLPEDAKAKVTEDLYDVYNVTASHILENFAPDIEMRPNLTAEAILKAENNILDNAAQNKNLRVLR